MKSAKAEPWHSPYSKTLLLDFAPLPISRGKGTYSASHGLQPCYDSDRSMNPFLNSRICPGIIVAAGFFTSAPLQAQVQVTSTIGTQHFTDGQIAIGSGTFNTAVSGQPWPFNGIIGSDAGAGGSNFDATWTMSYAPTPPVLGATLTIGVFDYDSTATGNQLALFTAAGVDLTSTLDVSLEKAEGGQYRVFTIKLPETTYTVLAAGSPSFQLTLRGPGLGVLGETPFNGAGLDFAQLNLTAVPEPEISSLITVTSGLGLLVAYFRRSSANR